MSHALGFRKLSPLPRAIHGSFLLAVCLQIVNFAERVNLGDFPPALAGIEQRLGDRWRMAPVGITHGFSP